MSDPTTVNTQKQRDSGSSVVMVIMIIVIIVLLGTLGWLFYQNLQKTSSTHSPQSSTTSPQPKPATDAASDWIKASSATGAFKIRIPDGWKIQNWTSRDYLLASTYQDITYTIGKPATITTGDTFTRDSGAPNHFSVTGNSIADKNIVGQPDATPQPFKTMYGQAGTKYVRTFDADTTDINGATVSKKGDKAYQYRFEGAKTLVTVDYYVAVGELDQTNLVEKAVKTLMFV